MICATVTNAVKKFLLHASWLSSFLYFNFKNFRPLKFISAYALLEIFIKKIYRKNLHPPSGVVQRKISRALRTDFFYTTPAFSDTTFLKSCIISCPEVEGTRTKLRNISKKICSLRSQKFLI